MIYFCEDCGAKNLLNSTQLITDKAIFRCNSCDYMNSYSIKDSKETDFKKKYDAFFMEIQGFPNIIGSFLFHKTTGVLKNNMPGILEKEDLDILGNILSNNYITCHSLYNDINEMVLIISKKKMVVKMIDKNLSIIIASKTFPLSKNIMNQLDNLASK